jgi:hypothetical protein
MHNAGKIVFRIGAVSNWIVAMGGIAPNLVAEMVKIEPVNYPFLVRIWTGMVFMFGCMFWEISSDLVGKKVLIKYAWIEKSITSISVTLGYFTGNVPTSLFVLILFTDYVWIPLFVYYDYTTRREANAG